MAAVLTVAMVAVRAAATVAERAGVAAETAVVAAAAEKAFVAVVPETAEAPAERAKCRRVVSQSPLLGRHIFGCTPPRRETALTCPAGIFSVRTFSLLSLS